MPRGRPRKVEAEMADEKNEAPKDLAKPDAPPASPGLMSPEAIRVEPGTQAEQEARARMDEEAQKAREAEAKAIREESKRADAAQPMIVESAESYKAKLYAVAMHEAAQMKMDETVPYGVYRDFAGRYVNAKGDVLNVEGVDNVRHSGQIREKAKLA